MLVPRGRKGVMGAIYALIGVLSSIVAGDETVKMNAAKQGVRLLYNVGLRRTVSWTGKRKKCERTVGEIVLPDGCRTGSKAIKRMGLGPSDLTRKENAPPSASPALRPHRRHTPTIVLGVGWDGNLCLQVV